MLGLSEIEFAVLQELLVRGQMSRSDLAASLGLSYSSIARAAQSLMGAAVVDETPDEDDVEVGRRRQLLTVRPAARHVIGVVITEDTAFAVGSGIGADSIVKAQRPLPPDGPDQVPTAVIDIVAELIVELAAGLPGLDAVGVSVAGVVVGNSVVERAAFHTWRQGTDLGHLLSERVDVPVVVCNDLDALSREQLWFGVGRTSATFGIVTVGQGIGFGTVHDHRVAPRIDDGLMLTHSPVGGTARCEFKHQGCAAAYLNRRLAGADVSGRWHPATLTQLARAAETHELESVGQVDDPEAVRAFVDGARIALAHLVVNVAGALQARDMVLGGEDMPALTEPGTVFWEMLEKRQLPTAAGHADPSLAMTIAGTTYDEWAHGAAVVALEHTLTGRAGRVRRTA